MVNIEVGTNKKRKEAHKILFLEIACLLLIDS